MSSILPQCICPPDSPIARGHRPASDPADVDRHFWNHHAGTHDYLLGVNVKSILLKTHQHIVFLDENTNLQWECSAEKQVISKSDLVHIFQTGTPDPNFAMIAAALLAGASERFFPSLIKKLDDPELKKS